MLQTCPACPDCFGDYFGISIMPANPHDWRMYPGVSTIDSVNLCMMQVVEQDADKYVRAWEVLTNEEKD